MTCDRATYRIGKDDFERLYSSSATGTDDSPDGAQVLRVDADVLVQKAGLKGGGVCGI